MGQYWPGLLLVVHLVVLLVFVFHPQQDLSITLLVILVGTGILHIWACVSSGVDTNWYLDVLNLIILAASTMISCSGGDGWQLGTHLSP